MGQGDRRLGQRLGSLEGGEWVQILLTHLKSQSITDWLFLLNVILKKITTK